MRELKRQEYDENGYVSYPGLVDPSHLEILLAEIYRISDGNTLAAHDKTRLEMEPNQKPDGSLDDADVKNGCLQVIPGRHKGKPLNHAQDGYFVGKIVEPLDESQAVALEGKAGTGIFMHAMTPHASVTNLSDRPRRTVILSYRAADAIPLFTGDTNELEGFTRLVRGKPAESARFSFQQFPMPPRKQRVASLYELQESSRKQTA